MDLAKAAKSGSIESIREFIAKGFDVDSADAIGRTPLMGAISNKRLEAIDVLLGNGANVEAVDSFANNALAYAYSTGSFEIVDLLKSGGGERIPGNPRATSARLLG